MILDLHHVQLAMPEGGEDAARKFYFGVLALREVEKPQQLRSRGGVWFESENVRVHLGTDPDFAEARKAHPAFQVMSMDDAISVLQAHGVAFRRDVDLPGMKRIYVDDPFGNRIELLELLADAQGSAAQT
jgi:catechol 2,3-dioxygenase-like lactoylglutathione lyase family enzyme